ncbi:flavin-containing monooxygenase [Mycolicibacter algericus]|uniref:flavin-containing monooxygenase n=1 Tax=Mycolicibacter algericus TaxID=1288388 RepID=UPI003C77C5EE
MADPDHLVAIVGAGPGGIAASKQLLDAGIDDFVILERADDFGGTWRDNHYPGLAVDIPVMWYQLSFAPNPDWSRLFAPGPEIYRYLRDTAARLGLYEHLRSHCDVTRQQWDATAQLWRLSIDGGQAVSARFVINSVGGYVNPKSAIGIEGIEDFTGTVLRPNAWDDGYDTAGKRIAVIGTGSSGVQIAAELSSGAATMEVYQRTPAWILPKIDFAIPRWLRPIMRGRRAVGAVNLLGRLAMDLFMVGPLVHLMAYLPDRVLIGLMPLYDSYCRGLYRLLLRAKVADPTTRRALVPCYGLLAKRPVISSAFLPALNDANTHLVTTPIERITATGVRTVDGVDHPADLIVAATGYELWTDPETYRPGTVLGSECFDLAYYYRSDGLRSYAGTAHPRLPNRWEIVGPLGFVGLAWMDYVETMAAHAVRVITETLRRGATSATVSDAAFQRWNDRMRHRGKAVHLYLTACNPGLSTYFVNSQRETVYHRPQTITGSRRFSRRSPLSDYEFRRPPEVQSLPRNKEISA